VAGAAHDSTIVQEETFGPVLVLETAADFEEALRLANGVRQGLVASLFSGPGPWRDAFDRSAQAGVLKRNTSTADADADAPFGGWKASGIGPPEHGPGDIEFFSRLQSTYEPPAAS
jgi:acyl-CoA reductase-like NAD-dependent aldehyde dehydrogenase